VQEILMCLIEKTNQLYQRWQNVIQQLQALILWMSKGFHDMLIWSLLFWKLIGSQAISPLGFLKLHK
jgi:hypothetical protein